MISLLLADDDAHLREFVSDDLQNEGYRVYQAEDGEVALKVLERERIHLAIVDIMMPKVDGFALCKEIRDDYDIPVLMLTAKGELEDKAKGFAAGTDDYVTKPFERKELIFRIKALLRRFQYIHQEIITIGEVTINRKSYEVECNGKTMMLPMKEFDLLAQLASFPNQTFTREMLIEIIWGNDFVGDDRTIDVHVKRLRKRFSKETDAFSIRTIRGVGYKMEVQD
ncbi:response regulator transcription factor [Natribacillus halophilus]|uniref:Heme response regulator HssR n=1 Tax=Natribacillus halophilus TaxID=549003 RepID=A0A1G8QMD2_9BACI|nr:response regulator transcription factor [Natribacillus halophilus]SDJ05942.1 DNA-binding response regulator, OmpR family, contains REC and winged-helix (wHTH) domain [Natribacillus halophilus]